MTAKKLSIILCAFVLMFAATQIIWSAQELQERQEYIGINGILYRVEVYKDTKTGDVFSHVYEGDATTYNYYNGKKFPNYPKSEKSARKNVFNINTNFANDLLSINIEAEAKTTATLNIYTISGKKVETKTFDLSKNSVYNHSTVSYTSGTYFYNITVDGNLLFEGQFVIVR